MLLRRMVRMSAALRSYAFNADICLEPCILVPGRCCWDGRATPDGVPKGALWLPGTRLYIPIARNVAGPCCSSILRRLSALNPLSERCWFLAVLLRGIYYTEIFL